MKKIRYKALLKLTILAAIFSNSAYADLLEYTFTSKEGGEKTVKANQTYVNAVGTLKMALSAGIDRKVRVSILDMDGNVVSTATSKLLTAEDQFIINEQKNYGAILELPAPGEGRYSIEAQIIGAWDNLVHTDSYPLIVDLTPPHFAGTILSEGHDSYANLGRGIHQDIDILSKGGSQTIFTNDLTDNNSIESIIFETALLNKTKITSVPGLYSDQTKQASVNVNYSQFFPTDGHEYHIQFIATDKAGNSSSFGRNVGVGSCASVELPIPVAQFVPGYSGSYAGQAGFQAWTNGGTIYKNPVKLLWRIPNSSLAPSNKYGIHNFDAIHNDGNFSYAITEKALTDRPEPNNGNWQTRGEWGCVTHDNIQGKLASGVEVSPMALGFDIKVQGRNLDVNTEHIEVKGNGNLEYITVKAEPRNYIQYVSVSPWDAVPNVGRTVYGKHYTCEIPVGANNCRLAINASPPAPSVWLGFPVYIANGDKTISYFAGYAEVIWDAITPEIRDIKYRSNSRSGTVTFYANDYNLVGNNYWWELNTKAVLSKNGTIVNELPLEASPTTNLEFKADLNLSTISTGKYHLSIVASDSVGNSTTKNYGDILIDHNPPDISVNINEGQMIDSLDKIKFFIKDNEGSEVKVESVNVKGGVDNLNINIGSSNNEGIVSLEYPVLFPTLTEGQNYSITLVAVDAQNNKSTKKLTFQYGPKMINLSSGLNGKIYIPALTTEFVHKDGARIIETEPLTLHDGSLVRGSYDVFATIRENASVPLVINGYTVVPGTTVSILKAHDFSQSGGKLSIPMSAAENGLIGQTDVMISTSAPNSPVLLLDVNTWMGTANLHSAKTEYRQVIDGFDITALPGEGTPCRLTSNIIVAKEADPIKDPVCLLEWTQYPDEAIPSGVDDESGSKAGLSGHAAAVGEHVLKYNLGIFNGNGEKYFIGQGSHSISVTSAKDSILYEPTINNLTFKRSIEDVSIRLKQHTGPTCSLTLNAANAISSAQNINNRNHLACLLEWTAFPEGVSQDPAYVDPKTKGLVSVLGEHNLSYRISTYSRLGAKVELATQTFPITIENPATPTISFSSDYHLKDNIYIVPMKGGRLGSLQVEADKGNILIETFEGEKMIDRKTYLPNQSRVDSKNVLSAIIPFSQSGLYDKKTYKAKVAYGDLPDVGDEYDFITYTVPVDGVRPLISVQKKAVSTEILPITVNMINVRNAREEYSSDSMGNWKVRLIQQTGKNDDDKALTDFHDMVNGEVTIDLDINDKSDLRSLKVYAEAVLIHQIPDYERIETSNRTAFVQILSGDAIDASVTTNKISGKAPFTTTFKLSLDNRLNNANTGDVQWQSSKDNGVTWVNEQNNQNQKMQFRNIFQTGTHLVRAITTNKHSGAKYTSESVEVIAYEGVSVDIEAPNVLFVGTVAHITAKPYVTRMPTDEELALIKAGELDGAFLDEKIPVPMEKVEIQWSTDGGKTYPLTGERIEMASDEVKRFNVFAKIKPIDAPEDDKYAYSTTKVSITFQKIKAPTIRIRGDSRVEVGKTHIFTATTTLPYKDFEGEVKGFFTLPNGEIVEKDTLEFVPTIEDMNLGLLEFKYTAWIDGYRDQGAESSSVFRTRTWQYIWPNFALDVRLDARFAPATAVLTVRPIGFKGELDNPEYKWTLPANAQLVSANSPTVRQVILNNAGKHTAAVSVVDARGNKTDLTVDVNISEPVPFKIDLQTIYSNSHLREPLSVRIRPTISGGHPHDRVKNTTYKLNGKKVEDTGLYGNLTNLKAGTYSVNFDIESDMKVKASQSFEFTVKDNKKPVCEPLTSKQTIASLIISASCKDEDGRIIAYNWKLNGDKVNVSNNRLVVNFRKGDVMPVISLNVVDDAGASSENYQLNN